MAGVVAKVAVIAGTVARAREVAKDKALPIALATSPACIRAGFGRGLVLSGVLVDDTAWPLADDVREAIELCIHAHSGAIQPAHNGNSQAQDAD